ncbi:TRAP transporter small permease [Chloroflexota bacterium]
MAFLTRFLEGLTRVFAPIGIGAMMVMMTVVTFNVIGRAFFHAPIYGSVEVVELTCLILISMVAAYTQLQRKNIAVSILVDRMSPRLREIFGVFTSLLSLFIMVLLLWNGATYAVETLSWGELTYVFELSTLPFRVIWLIGLSSLILVLISQIFQSLGKVVK